MSSHLKSVEITWLSGKLFLVGRLRGAQTNLALFNKCYVINKSRLDFRNTRGESRKS